MSTQTRYGECQRSREGFILVAALWILLALATLASVAAVYMSQSAVALTVNDEAVQTEALADASLELTAYKVSSVTPDQRPTQGAFRFRMLRANVSVEFVSEAARIDLNSAPKPMIAGLFTVLGASPEAAAAYADRVVAWRTPPQQGVADGEDALYRAAGLRYSPRRAPFNHVDELWLVLNLPPALVERALPFVTIYSGLGTVNVLDAQPEVIAALPGMSAARLSAFLNQRDSLPVGNAADRKFIADALGDNQTGVSTQGSDAYRVRTRIVFDNGWRKVSEAVIMMLVANVGEPYRVLSWRDDIDLASGPLRAGGG
jgi:general secretion pathway protein K